ncbi:MAG: rhodanese-like domain-containing protein [Pseudomonadota bacterium]
MRITIAALVLLLQLLSTTTTAEDTMQQSIWIDVRTPEEFAQGHIQDAVLIPHENIESGVSALNIDKDAVIFLYCGKGGRAEKAQTRLTRLGYSNVTNVGGLEDARKLTGQPH